MRARTYSPSNGLAHEVTSPFPGSVSVSSLPIVRAYRFLFSASTFTPVAAVSVWICDEWLRVWVEPLVGGDGMRRSGRRPCPAIESGFQPGGKNARIATGRQEILQSQPVRTVLSGRLEAALYGSQDGRRYGAGTRNTRSTQMAFTPGLLAGEMKMSRCAPGSNVPTQ